MNSFFFFFTPKHLRFATCNDVPGKSPNVSIHLLDTPIRALRTSVTCSLIDVLVEQIGDLFSIFSLNFYFSDWVVVVQQVCA